MKTLSFSENCIEKKADYPGGYLSRIMSTTLPSCVEQCQKTNLCSRIVYLESEKECHLKDKSHGERTKSDWKWSSVSVWMRCLEEYLDVPPTEAAIEVDVPEKCLEKGVDYPGGVMETVTDVNSMTECAELCVEDESCELVVILPRIKVCFLKGTSRGDKTYSSRYAQQGAISIAMDCWKEMAAKNDENKTEEINDNFEKDEDAEKEIADQQEYINDLQSGKYMK